MALIDQVLEILNRLKDEGWRDVFAQHGLSIDHDTPESLTEELLRLLESIDRNAPGFEDFAINGTRGIEPGKPALSLLFHGFASPHVHSYIAPGGTLTEVTEYPTPKDLEVLENLVYGLASFSLEDIRSRVGNVSLAIVVYAKEYRIASNTFHQQHADMCYSRTGVARVGTSESEYLSRSRGYMPEDAANPSRVRVLPCRYTPYIAALVQGDEAAHIPMRFITSSPSDQGDASRQFWIPVHKLFSGSECLFGYDLDVQLIANHINEKIRRVHLKFEQLGHNGGWHEPDLSNSPFRFTDRIANFANPDENGPGLLVPEVHPAMVEIATYQGEVLTYNVPDGEQVGTGVLSSSLYLQSAPSGARFAPEYVHARFVVEENGDERDLNTEEDVADTVYRGDYKAKHLLDFTGDGWIDVICTALNLEIPRRLAAYSLVTPPDYFVKVKQTGLMQWWEQRAPQSIKDTVWPENPGLPQALSDQRLAANLGLEQDSQAIFQKNDDTMTAIVGQLNVDGGEGTRVIPPQSFRHSMLTDGAAGVFAPGWDVSLDEITDGDGTVIFFSTHGLGSPFPEDAKLCAALSAYWPAASPDITRTFQPYRGYATATPLLDTTIGQPAGSTPWDGIPGPKIIDETNKIIEYNNIDYGDYVQASLENTFLANVIGEIDQNQYIARTVAMARAYQVLGAMTTSDKVKYAIYSFTLADRESDPELQTALEETGSSLIPNYSYRFEIFEHKPVANETGKPFNKFWIGYDEMQLLYADSTTVLKKNNEGNWTAQRFRD